MEEIYCFGGNPLDRASERRRDTLWIQSLLDDPSARILPLCELRPLIRVESAGWVRRCPECKASHYPRSDPVTIMLAVRGDYGLLGRGRRRPGARFSCLAGFMEPGETMEEAVRREVHEESGIRVGRVKYLACQPWPFPSSLMMGFLCEGLSEEITVDPEELAEARWFHRDEIRAMVVHAANGLDDPTQVSVPGPVAIAHHICRRWSNGLDSL